MEETWKRIDVHATAPPAWMSHVTHDSSHVCPLDVVACRRGLLYSSPTFTLGGFREGFGFGAGFDLICKVTT